SFELFLPYQLVPNDRRSGTRSMDRKLGQHIGMIARKARLALDVTQEDVATQIGISTEYYSRIERGYALPSITTLIHMALPLGLSTDSLLGLRSDHGSR